MPLKVFNKLIEYNPQVDYAINCVLAEFDIKAAHTSAMYFIKGEDTWKELLALDKLSRNTKIGLMMKDDPDLHDKIAKLLLTWFNKFCEINNIMDRNFVSSTRDSMLLINKRPLKCELENGIVTFRNKDGEFTSYIRINNFEVLFDGMSYNLRIKGINKEFVDGNPVFIKLFKQLLALVESSKNLSTSEILKKADRLRNRYINSKDPTMWASITDGNKYVYNISGELVLSDVILPEEENCTLIKIDNYYKLFLPVFKICFKPH